MNEPRARQFGARWDACRCVSGACTLQTRFVRQDVLLTYFLHPKADTETNRKRERERGKKRKRTNKQKNENTYLLLSDFRGNA